VGKIVHFSGPNHSGSFSKMIRSFRSFRSFITSGSLGSPPVHRPGQPCHSNQSVRSRSKFRLNSGTPREIYWPTVAPGYGLLLLALGGMGWDVTLRSLFHKCDYKVQQKLFLIISATQLLNISSFNIHNVLLFYYQTQISRTILLK